MMTTLITSILKFFKVSYLKIIFYLTILLTFIGSILYFKIKSSKTQEESKQQKEEMEETKKENEFLKEQIKVNKKNIDITTKKENLQSDSFNILEEKSKELDNLLNSNSTEVEVKI